MSGKRIGYKRVSTLEQNPDSQLIGLELDKVYVEYETGFSTEKRQQLKNLKDYVREDDIVFVECMDRLGRKGDDLDDIVDFFLNKGAQVHFVREGIVLGKKDDLMAKLSYDMMKAFINFYSRLAKERQRRGIERAKAEGKYRGGKKKLDDTKVAAIKHRLNTTRDSKNQIARDFGIHRRTLYKYLKEVGNGH